MTPRLRPQITPSVNLVSRGDLKPRITRARTLRKRRKRRLPASELARRYRARAARERRHWLTGSPARARAHDRQAERWEAVARPAGPPPDYHEEE